MSFNGYEDNTLIATLVEVALKPDATSKADYERRTLYPHIYLLLCVEVLSIFIRAKEVAGQVHGCKIAHGAPSISHLFRANRAEVGVTDRDGLW